MSDRLIAVIQAEKGYFVSFKEITGYNEPPAQWSPWREVIAWGFSEWNGPIPITLYGRNPELADQRIRTPAGEVV